MLIYDIAVANSACVAIATVRLMHILLHLLLQAMMMIVVIRIIACVLVVYVRRVDAWRRLLDM